MGLGNNEEISKNEFIEAMRLRLNTKEVGLGDNVDDPEVNANLGALGLAVYQILTAHAAVKSDTIIDNNFWAWINDVNEWLTKLSSWQNGIVQTFNNWTPTMPSEIALKEALINVANPGTPPGITPTVLKGKIE